MSAEPSPFQALIFDLGGVIVAHDNSQLFERLANRCRAEDALQRMLDDNTDPRYGSGELGIEHLHGRLVDELGYQGGWDDFRADFCSHFSVDHGMLGLVTALARTNRVMLLSNTNKVHWEYILDRTGGALAAFEPYLSHEIGAVKPNLEAFAIVAERAGVEPAACLFIDDRPENVEAARLAGFEAVQFTDQGALEALLDHRGVRWTRQTQEAFP